MNLTERIAKETLTAMKEQDKFKVSVLRMLKSALQLESISKKHELTDEEAIAVVKKQVKVRKDSIEEYTKYERIDLVENLEKEVAILKEYLPEELTKEQLQIIIDEAIAELKPNGKEGMGQMMKYLTAKVGTQADMKEVSALVREKLNQ